MSTFVSYYLLSNAGLCLTCRRVCFVVTHEIGVFRLIQPKQQFWSTDISHLQWRN